jgi:lysophospholipase L1-like esterase
MTNTLTREEITQAWEQLTKLQNWMFYLSMKDRWNNDDYNTNNKWNKEYNTIRQKLIANGVEVA